MDSSGLDSYGHLGSGACAWLGVPLFSLDACRRHGVTLTVDDQARRLDLLCESNGLEHTAGFVDLIVARVRASLEWITTAEHCGPTMVCVHSNEAWTIALDDRPHRGPRATAGHRVVTTGQAPNAADGEAMREVIAQLALSTTALVDALTRLGNAGPLDASLLPGWSRLTIACHLRYGARALAWVTDRPTSFYPRDHAEQ